MKGLIEQTRRLKNKIQALEFLADSETIMGSITCRNIAGDLIKDCLKLQAALGLFEARIHPAEGSRGRIPGSRYERNEYRSRYRCWSCKKFGNDCINMFLNRPACKMFLPNAILKNNLERVNKLRKTRGDRPPKLKPPIIPEFNHHYMSCKVCDRISKSDKEDRIEKQYEHYLKVKIRKRKKLTVYFGFFGVRYSEDYIFEWEE